MQVTSLIYVHVWVGTSQKLKKNTAEALEIKELQRFFSPPGGHMESVQQLAELNSAFPPWPLLKFLKIDIPYQRVLHDKRQ